MNHPPSIKGFLLLIFLLQPALTEAQLYKCIQPDGVTIYTDQGCSSRQRPQAPTQKIDREWLTADLSSLPALWREKAHPLLLQTQPSQLLLLLYLIMSTVCFTAYSLDKKRAVRGMQRTPEARLHIYELLCGWPGGLLAQRVIRHKNRKKPYQQRFWLIVLINLSATSYFLAKHFSA